jgi:hypothetical protein
MLRSLTPLAVVLVAGLAAPQLPAALSEIVPPPAFDQSPMPTPVQGCCKHCTKGKPCGDTCIARNKTCHVGPGCAC